MEHLFNISEISIIYNPKRGERPSITTSSQAAQIVRLFFPEETIQLQERFIAVYLNRANKVLGAYTVSIGGITGTVADVRLILSVALKAAATNIILAHNHPSGSTKPSKADVDLTIKIKDAASFMDIKVIDHIIVSPEIDIYYSFADEGIL